MSETHEGLPILDFEDASGWIAWLEQHHAQKGAIWIRMAKKRSGEKSISYEGAREGAIMYGWIDGLRHALDKRSHAIRFSPRRAQGMWSKINCEIAEELIREGKMKPPGLKEVEAAKKDGRWESAYDSPSNAKVPPDFRKLLDQSPVAKEAFEALNSANRYAFLYRIQTAKRAETREARMAKYIEMLEAGETFH